MKSDKARITLNSRIAVLPSPWNAVGLTLAAFRFPPLQEQPGKKFPRQSRLLSHQKPHRRRHYRDGRRQLAEEFAVRLEPGRDIAETPEFDLFEPRPGHLGVVEVPSQLELGESPDRFPEPHLPHPDPVEGYP